MTTEEEKRLIKGISNAINLMFALTFTIWGFLIFLNVVNVPNLRTISTVAFFAFANSFLASWDANDS